MRSVDEAAFRAYVAARATALRRTAFLLCGDWHHAEDLVQASLTQLFVHWGRVRDPGAVDAWVRTALVRRAIDERRRPWRRERTVVALPDSAAPAAAAPEDRLDLLAALRRLPPRQRAALVLRYFEDADIAETARVLGCSEGTVKSTTSRALAALRTLLGEATSRTEVEEARR